MQIIREATTQEAINLDPAIEFLVDQMVGWMPIVLMASFLIAVTLVLITDDANALLLVVVAAVFMLVGSVYAGISDHITEKTYTHDYYLAIIDNSENFEHEEYELLDHHEDNTYFVENINND